MENCIHEVVCKYKGGHDELECGLKDMCKFISSKDPDQIPGLPKKKRKYKKRDKGELPLAKKKPGKHKGNKWSSYLHLTTSTKDVQRARVILKLRQVRGSLTDDQSAALDMYKDIRVNDLSEVQRQQILNIFKDTIEK